MHLDATPAGPAAAIGLTSEEAARLLAQHGPNSVQEEPEHPIRRLVSKFWAPVPWMLEAAVLLEILLHKNIEAGVIAGLLVFNASLSFAQESNAQAALRLLRRRLAILAPYDETECGNGFRRNGLSLAIAFTYVRATWFPLTYACSKELCLSITPP